MGLLAVGIVRSAHGTAGEVRVRSFSGETAHLLALRAAVLRRGGCGEQRMAIVGARAAPPDVLMSFAGVDRRERAQALVGCELWVDRDQAAPRAAGEHYAADLCRCGVFLDGRRVGSVAGICEAGEAALLEVRKEDGTMFLLPFSDHFVGEVDVEGGRIELRGGELLA